MFPVQNGLICWLDAMDGKAGDTLLKDRTSYGHNLIVENFQQGYGFTGTSIKVKQSNFGTSNNNALYIANGGFKTSCKSFCICIERHNTNQPWYIFDGRGLNGQGLNTNYCYNGNIGSSYDNSKTRRDGVLTYDNSNLDINKKTFLYFELKEAELFTLSILMRFSKNENTEGEFYSLYAYNRALTEEEILQNMEYENNKISYVNETNLPKIVDKLSNASNIKITGNKYGNRVQTVIDKIVEKADNVTKAIEQEVVNDSYSFKVGTGQVDVSADVEDGFGEVGVKGVTYQNLFINCNNSNCFNNYIHWSVVAENTFEVVADGTNKYLFIKKANMLLKPSTQYTFIFEVLENTLVSSDEGSYVFTIFGSSGSIVGGVALTGSNVKTTVFLKTTVSDLDTAVHGFDSYLNNRAISGKLKVRLTMLEGDHINNPNLPSYFEGIVGVGDKSKNLLNPNSFKSSTGISMIENQVINIDVPTDGGQRTIFEGLNLPAGTYRVTTKVLEGEYTGGNLIFYDSNGEKFTENRLIGSYTINATNNNINKLLIWAVKGICKIRIQLEKGSSETPYEPYYDGHKIEILSNGKNLVNPLIPYPYDIKKNEYNDGTLLSVVKVKPNTTYTMSVDRTNEKGRIVAKFSNRLIYASELNGGVYSQSSVYNFLRDNYANGRKFEYTIQTGSKITFTTLDDCNFIYLNTDGAYGGPFNNGEYVTTINNVQIEEGTTVISYEPYVSDKTQILLDEPLMRLPNGVCDEITRDGKLIRRIGKVLLDGSQHFNQQRVFDDRIVFGTQIDNILVDKRGGILPIADNFPCANQSDVWNGIVEGLGYSDIASGHIRVSINKSRLSPENRDGLKNFFTTNPTTLYYQLNTPTITDITPATLRIFKNGHLTFNTLVAPESTHYVQLNKSAQIQSAIKESQWLDNKIDSLENGYDTLMLSTMSILDNLELDYTLK